MIVGLMPIVLDKDRAPHLTYFIDFLQQCSHTRITLDQWESFLQFNHTVKADLSNWEDDGACKSLHQRFEGFFTHIFFRASAFGRIC